LRWIAI